MMRGLVAALAALLVSVGPASAGPVSAAIATFLSSALGTTVAASAVTGFFVRTAISVAFSALAQALRGKPRPPGVRTDVTLTGGTNPQTFVGGRYATAGVQLCPPMSHGEASGTPNAYLTYVVALSAIPLTEVARLWVDGKDVSFGDEVHPDYGMAADGDHAGYLWMKVLDGSQTAADPMLLAKYGDYPERPWQADMVGRDQTIAILTFRRNQSLFPGLPRCLFEVRGIAFYDPRQDGSADGTGSHRWADRTTWQPTDNPLVMAYCIARGLPMPDGSVYGGGVAAEDLPSDVWFAAMNACDADAETENSTEPAYRAGYEFSLDEEPFDAFEELMKAASAEFAEVGGVWYVRVGAVGLPVYFISDNDVRRDKEQELDPFPGLAETWNAVQASFPDPDAMWEPADAPGLYDDDLEAEDGGRRLSANLNLLAVPYAEQVQRLMRAWREDARRFRRHRIVLPPDALAVNPLDAISWTSARNGYVDKVFEVGAVQLDPRTLNVGVSLRERDPGDYDWQASDLQPVTPPSVVVVEPAPLSVPGWSVQPATIVDEQGIPWKAGIQLGVTPGLDDIDGLKWEGRVAGTSDLVLSGSTALPESGHVILSENVLPATDYEVRGRLQTSLQTIWTDWTAVTTPSVGFPVGAISDEVWDAINGAAQDVADQVLGAYDTATVQPIVDLQALIAGQLVALTGTETIAEISTELQGIATPLVDVVGAVQLTLGGTIEDIARIDKDLQLDESLLGDTTDAIDTVREQLTQLWAEYSFTSELIAGAGIYVDEATGKVEVSAFQTSQDQISEVAIRLDAAEATLSLTATQTWVNQALTDLVLDPSQIPVVGDLQLSVATLEIEMDAAEAAIDLKADLIIVEGIDLRVSSAELSIDALESQIALTVDNTTFGELEDRVSSAELILDATDGATISQMVSDVRILHDGLDEADLQSLETLLGAYEQLEGIYASLAYAREEITARIIDGEEAFAAQVLELAAGIDDNLALIEQETTVRATETTALAEDVSTLQVENATQAAQIVQINTVSTDSESAVASGLAQLQIVVEGAGGTVEAIQQLEGRVEDTEDGLLVEAAARESLVASAADIEDDAALNDLANTLSTYEGRLTYEEGLAQAREELTTLVIEGISAEAAKRTALEATVAGNAATLAAEQLVRATADAAIAQDIVELDVVVNDPDTGVEATATAVSGIVSSVSAIDGEVTAVSGRVDDLEATVNDPTTGVDATASLVSGITTTVSQQGDDITAQAGRIDDLEATVDDPTTGVDATATLVSGLTTTVSQQGDDITAQAGRIDDLEATVNDPTTGVDATATLVSGLTTTVSHQGNSITALSGRTDDLESTVYNPTTGVAATASGLSSLVTQVNTQGDTLTATTERVDALESTVNDPSNGVAANASAVDGLQSTVTSHGSTISAHSGRLTNLEATVNDPSSGVSALGSAVTDLAADISANGGAITVVSGRVTDLEATVDNPTTGVAATAAALGQLATRVDDTEDALTVQAQDITQLEASIGQGANLVPDAQMTEPSLWTRNAGWSLDTPTSSVKAHGSIGTLKYVRTGSSGDSASAYSARFKVKPGAAYNVSVETSRRAGSGSWKPVARLRWLDADGVSVGDDDLGDVVINGGALQVLSDSFVAPAGAVRGEWRFFCRLGATSTDFDIGLPVVEELTDADIANAAAVSSLSTTVSQQGNDITAQAGRIDDLEATVNDPTTGVAVTASAVDDLQTTVGVQSGVLVAHVQRLTSLESTVEDPSTGVAATATAVSQLTTDVQQNGTDISAISTAVDSLEATVNDPSTGVDATATALGGLTTQVSNQGTAIGAVAGRVDALESTVNDPSTGVDATATALGQLATTVSSQGDTITAQAQQITDISAQVGQGGNLIADAAITDPAAWDLGAGWSVLSPTSSGAGHTSIGTLRYAYSGGTGNSPDVTSLPFKATAGATYTFSFSASRWGSGQYQVVGQVEWLDVNDQPIAWSTLGDELVTSAGLQTWSDQVVAPTGAKRGRFRSLVRRSVTTSSVDVGSMALEEISPQEAATASAVQALTVTVEGQGDDITAVAEAVTDLETTVGGHTTQISQTIQSVDGIYGVYGLQINNNGHVSGFGLVSDLVDGTPVGSFTVVADSFSLVAPNGTQESSPFIAYTTPQVIDGVSVPAGVYLRDAYIRRGVIGRAEVADVIESDNYAEAGGLATAGLQLDFANGRVKAADVVLSRNIVAASGLYNLGTGSIGGGNTGGFAELQEWWVQTTIPLSAWGTVKKSYIATADLNETSVNSSAPNNCFWGLTAEVVPLTAFYNSNNSPTGQFLYLRIRLWGKQVNTISRSSGNLIIDWTIYQVT